MAIIKENTQVAIKIEAVEGTKETLAAADFLECFAVVPAPEIEEIFREVMAGHMSKDQGIKGKRLGKCSFSCDLRGSGTAGTAPDFGKVLKACGFSETIVPATSVTYAPTSVNASVASVTIGFYMDGFLFEMWGCRGNVKLKMVAGKPGQLDFEFQGADWQFTDVALLTGLAPMTTKSQAFLSASFTDDSFAACVENIDIDMGNVLSPDIDVNKASGHKLIEITDRKPVGSTDPRVELVTTYDHFGKLRSNNQGALSFVLGATAGNILTTTIPQARPTSLTFADRTGIRNLGKNFTLDRNTVAGDDEISLAFT